jgi:hypothetical protein
MPVLHAADVTSKCFAHFSWAFNGETGIWHVIIGMMYLKKSGNN